MRTVIIDEATNKIILAFNNTEPTPRIGGVMYVDVGHVVGIKVKVMSIAYTSHHSNPTVRLTTRSM